MSVAVGRNISTATTGTEDGGTCATPFAHLAPLNKGSLKKVKGLRQSRTAVALTHREDNAGHGHGITRSSANLGGSAAHHHEPKAPSLFTAMASAAINFLLQFGLCCAYGIIMFEDTKNAKHRGLGVKMNLCSAMIAGFLLSSTSKVAIAMGGPDLNPVVFLGMFVSKIGDSIAEQRDLNSALTGCPTLSEAARKLGGGSSSDTADFCVGAHYEAHAADCDAYHLELRATAIFAVTISSLILGCLFASLGYFRMTKFVSYVPTNIMEAFLSCVGYKVFNYALKFCKYKPQQFVPAACVGVPLYFLKALHMGNPAIVIPGTLITPLAIFWACVYASGGNVYSARKSGWLFDEIENVDFYSVWRDGLLASSNNINFEAWMATLTDLVVMVTVVLLDCMLKMSSTESKIPVQLDKDYEIQLYGLANFGTTMCGASVGYMQLKFNVINFGILGNVVDRRAGAAYAGLCGLIFFWTTDMFNYLPRFFLSTLLFFAGSGFVVENLWGSRKYLSTPEWLQIFFILVVFVGFNSLLYAVIAGGLITGATFILRYATIPCVAGKPRAGGEGRALQRRSFIVQKKIQHIANSWLLVIHLKGFIFFGSAEKLVAEVVQRLEWQRKHVPGYQRLHWLIFDCGQLDGMDSSASKAFGKLAGVAEALHLEIIWSGVEEDLIARLKVCGTITDDQQLSGNLTEAKNAIENTIQEYISKQQVKWLELHPFFGLVHEVMRDRMCLEPFEDVFKTDMSRFGCPWSYCHRIKIKAFTTLLWTVGELRKTVYVVHSGKVGMFLTLPNEDCGDWSLPVSIHGRGQLLNHEAFCKVPTRYHAVAIEDGELLAWSEVQWTTMVRENPPMAASMMQAMLKQEEEETDGPKAVGVEEKINTAFHRDQECMEAEEEGLKKVPRATTTAHFQSASGLQLGEDILSYLRPLHIAKGLAELGLFNPPGNSATPRLTPHVVEHVEKDLTVAFHTYCVGNAQGSFVPAEKVAEALLYAGVFGIALTREKIGDLTQAEFVSMGKDLVMSSFSKKQMEILLGIARQSGKRFPVSRTELGNLLREKVHCDISLEEVDDLINFCSTSTARTVDEDTFLAIMSRLVRKYEKEWCVLLGIRQLLRETESEELNDRLQAEALVSSPVGGRLLQSEEAKELLWASNFCSSPTDLLPGLDIRMVLLALWPSDIASIELPPPPRMTTWRATHPYAGEGPTPAPPMPQLPSPRNATKAPIVESTAMPMEKHKLQVVASLFGGSGGPMSTPHMGHSGSTGYGESLSWETNSKATAEDILLEESALFWDTPLEPKLPQAIWGESSRGLDSAKRQEGDFNNNGIQWVPQPTEIVEPKWREDQHHTPSPRQSHDPMKHHFHDEILMSSMRRQLIDVRNMLPAMGESLPSKWPRLRLQRKQTTLGRAQTDMSGILREEEHSEKPPEEPKTIPEKIRDFLDYPESGKWASRWSAFMGLLIVVAVLSLVAQPLISPPDEPLNPTEEAVWKNVERFFTVVFSSEYVGRALVTWAISNRELIAFLKAPMNLCDIAAVLPWYMDKILGSYQEQFRLLRICRLFRLARLVRLGRLAKKSAQLTPIAVILVLTWGIFMKSTFSNATPTTAAPTAGADDSGH